MLEHLYFNIKKNDKLFCAQKVYEKINEMSVDIT